MARIILFLSGYISKEMVAGIILNADDATGMLYVSHGKMVNVVDMNTGKSVATITDVNGVHGIAIAPEFNKGFISNGPDSNVTIFNTKGLQHHRKVKSNRKGSGCNNL